MPQTFPTRAGSTYVLQQLQFFASRQQSHAARWGRPSQCVVCHPATAAPGVARASGGQRPLSCGRWGCRRSRRQHCALRSLGCGHAALRSRRSSSVACVSGAERSAATGSALPPGPHPRFAGKGHAESPSGRAPAVPTEHATMGRDEIHPAHQTALSLAARIQLDPVLAYLSRRTSLPPYPH